MTRNTLFYLVTVLTVFAGLLLSLPLFETSCYVVTIEASDTSGITVHDKPLNVDVVFRQNDAGYVLRGIHPTYNTNMPQGFYLVYLTSKDIRAYRVSNIIEIAIETNAGHDVFILPCR